ncbi:MAG: hypothetical protein JSV84_04865 [Gemmatimonadota bacterium]|nr:MAG: hypothetical protein JSV84_04865 [Gemmatimonadota bacterium]
MIYRSIILVIALLVYLPITLLAQPYEGEKGDVNNDGTVDLLDILETVNIVLGTQTPDNDEFWRADCNASVGNCNGDGTVDLFDIVKIANITLGIDSCPSTTVTDIDGNVYQTITIGTQVWMAENLKVTHYRNGDYISYATSYDNDENNIATYGLLYNWSAVNDSRGLAPEGWHMPSDDEWQTLIDYLGGDSVAGGKMKESGTLHWQSPNTGATNESGFTALPGGTRGGGGNFSGMGNTALFNSSTELDNYNAWSRALRYDSSSVSRLHLSKQDGFSVRCVRD